MGMTKFDINMHQWTFPLSVIVNLVGNNHRIYNIIMGFLCFRIVFCIDEDAR